MLDSILDVYTSFNNASNGLFSGRIYGNDSQIGETGIRICELGSDLSANNTYPLSVLADGNYVMNVTAQGNVGIGTASFFRQVLFFTSIIPSFLCLLQ